MGGVTTNLPAASMYTTVVPSGTTIFDIKRLLGSVLIFVSGWGILPGEEPKNPDFDLKTLENLLFLSPPQAPPKIDVFEHF